MNSSGSWTAAMRPDYTLSVLPGKDVSEIEAERNDSIIHIHFDAKYRVEKLLAFKEMDDEALNEEKVEQEKGNYKRADLLKMHAYKDAIRRTSGAYILYPGDGEDQVFRGFHEIIPGLGAFSVKPKNYDNDAREIKEFIRLTVNHLLDRTSQREDIQRHEHRVHTNKKKDQERLEARIPETIFPVDEKVIVGFYKSVNRSFIEKIGFPVKVNTKGASVKIDKDLMHSSYILIYDEYHEIEMLKLKQFGYNICTMTELKEKGFVSESSKEDNNVYMMFRIDKEGLEREWIDYVWDYGKVIQPISKAKGKSKPVVMNLNHLLKVNSMPTT